MPRFHRFNGDIQDVWIDLDAITMLKHRGIGTQIMTGGYSQEVYMGVNDVLALISPPAAPDRFEEHIRYEDIIGRAKQQHAAELEDRPMTAEPEAGPADVNKILDEINDEQKAKRIRLDELTKLIDFVNTTAKIDGFASVVVAQHVINRIMEIRQGKV